MSNQKTFDEIYNQFESDNESDNREDENQKTSSFEYSNNKRGNSLSNNKRNEFGYFIGNDENEESENSNSNNEEQKEENSIKNEEENEDYIISNQEEESNENKSKKSSEDDNENVNKNDSSDKEEKNEENKKIYEHLYNENEEQNDFRKSNKNEKDSIEGENLRIYSFRPNPIPVSPQFTKKISNNNNINNVEIKNNDLNINNNLNNFTETIKTKIEEENSNKNEVYNSENNNYKNYITLGKMSNKDILNNSDKNNIIKENNNKNFEDEEEDEEEEAFLKREELKRQKNMENRKLENIQINEKEIEDKNKDNIKEYKELPMLNQLIKYKNENENNNNNNMNNNKESNIKEELREDEENNHEINNINNNNYNIKDSYNETNNIKIDDEIKPEKNKDTENEQNNIKQSNDNNLYNDNANKDNLKEISSERKNNKVKKNIISSSKNNKSNSPSIENKKYNQNYYSENKKKNLSNNKNESSNKKNNYNNYKNNNSKTNNISSENDLHNKRKKQLDKQKKEIKSKLYEPKNTNTNYSPEKYSFLPKINKKSREICRKKYNLNKTPINDLLYEDAKNKKGKLNQIYLDEQNNILSNANIKKINNNSYNIAISRINKKIENTIKKYSITGKLSIERIAQCLYELNIITELIKIKDKEKNNNDNLKLSYLQSIISSINEKDVIKLNEIELLEQLWFIINPSQTQYINSNILCELLKTLLISNDNIKNIENKIEKIFEKYNINKEEYENENDESFISPLRDKKYNKSEIWPIKKMIKTFLNIKKNLKAYKDKDNYYQTRDKYNKIIKERNNDLTFKPNLISNSFFNNHSKYNYNKENYKLKSSNNSKNKKNDFDKTYKRFMEEKELHDNTLERIRQIKREKELKKYTYIPKINKYPSYLYKNNNKKSNTNTNTINSEDLKMLKKSKSYIDLKSPRYQKLYNMRKNFYENDNKNISEEENYTFKPVLISNNEIISKMKKIKKPKGYNEYIQKNRSLLEKKKNEKKIEEDKIYGRNYDQIQKMKLKPFNITDLNNKSNKKKKNNNKENLSSYDENLEQNIRNEIINNKEDEKNENIIIDGVYITIDIRVPNGLYKPLKIYNTDDNNTIELVNNFCKIYSINDEDKKIILKIVMEYKNYFFGRNINGSNNKNDALVNEDLDTITNTYNSNDKNF